MAESTLTDKHEDRTPLVDQASTGGIAGAAMIIMLGNVLSRVLGMAREQLAAGLFGTGDRIAAFTVADNVHALLFDLLISGMLQAALVPVLAQWTAPDAATREELRRISGALLTLAVIVVGTMVVIGVVFAPAVVEVMTALGGGGGRGAETTTLTVTLVRMILPAVFFLAIGVVLMGVLYALGRVTAPALSVGVRNFALVASIVLFAGLLGVKSMALGVVIGSVAIAAMQIPPLRRAGALPRPNLAFGHPGVRRVLKLYVPIFLGLLANTVAVVVDRNLAWGAERDALGAMRYATTLVQLVLGLVAAAISLAALPSLSRHFATGDETAFQATLGRALAMVTVLIVPAVFGLAAISRPAVDLLFRHGETGSEGAHLIVVALLGYLPGTLFAAYDQVLIFAFYARQNTRTPVLVGLGAIAVYFAVALALVNSLGMLGLVLANSAQFVVHAVVMYWLARRSFGPAGGDDLRRVAIRCLGAGAGMSILCLGVWQALAVALPDAGSTTGYLAREGILVALPVAAGGVVYVGALHRWRLEEIAVLRRAILRKVAPRWAG
ncbi:MAG: putative peptidoglycan lipid flippase [Thermomicrobiales bacterium]|nr:putative peptidoglycan lipid flippase [Thermomicrobiales bacterium]